MKRGFTLIELLVVVGIMGLMGTVSVGAYQQMKRGMEESQVVDNVSKFIQLVAERAEIDRRPTAVCYWNELVREETEDEPAIVIGHAVAVRQRGRISRVVGQWLADEYGDLEQFDEYGDYAELGSSASKQPRSRLYLFDNIKSDGLRYSEVRSTPQTYDGKNTTGQTEVFLTCDPQYNSAVQSNLKGGNGGANSSSQTKSGKIIQYGYYIVDGKTASSKWKAGSAYGYEFQSLTLPQNYIFGNKYPKKLSDSIDGEGSIVFDSDQTSTKGGNTASGGSTVRIYVLKQGSSGEISPQSIGSTEAPKIKLNW